MSPFPAGCVSSRVKWEPVVNNETVRWSVEMGGSSVSRWGVVGAEGGLSGPLAGPAGARGWAGPRVLWGRRLEPVP